MKMKCKIKVKYATAFSSAITWCYRSEELDLWKK